MEHAGAFPIVQTRTCRGVPGESTCSGATACSAGGAGTSTCSSFLWRPSRGGRAGAATVTATASSSHAPSTASATPTPMLCFTLGGEKVPLWLSPRTPCATASDSGPPPTCSGGTARPGLPSANVTTGSGAVPPASGGAQPPSLRVRSVVVRCRSRCRSLSCCSCWACCSAWADGSSCGGGT